MEKLEADTGQYSGAHGPASLTYTTVNTQKDPVSSNMKGKNQCLKLFPLTLILALMPCSSLHKNIYTYIHYIHTEIGVKGIKRPVTAPVLKCNFLVGTCIIFIASTSLDKNYLTIFLDRVSSLF